MIVILSGLRSITTILLFIKNIFMKKNFKFQTAQVDLLRQSISDFQNDSLKKVAEDMIGGIAAPHSKSHITAGWTRSRPSIDDGISKSIQ